MKNNITSKLFLIINLFVISCIYGQTNRNNSERNKGERKDSIRVLRSDSVRIYSLSTNGKINSRTEISQENYHVINFDTAEIILYMYNNKTKKWNPFSNKYYSIKESSNMLEFSTDNGLYDKVNLDINPYVSIGYLDVKANKIYEFPKVTLIDNSLLKNLGFYKWKNSFHIYEDSNVKNIVLNEIVKGFEYSEYWKKEAYEKVTAFMKSKIKKSNPNCAMVSRELYNANKIRFIGNQGYLVNFYCQFDCKRNHTNQSYFMVEAYYLGKGKWDLELIDQRLTH